MKRGIFQEDSLLPLLFLLYANIVVRQVNSSYGWIKKECKLNHLLFMDDLKRSEEQTDTHVRTVHVASTDVEMEFGMKKCGILTMKREKVVIVKE